MLFLLARLLGRNASRARKARRQRVGGEVVLEQPEPDAVRLGLGDRGVEVLDERVAEVQTGTPDCRMCSTHSGFRSAASSIVRKMTGSLIGSWDSTGVGLSKVSGVGTGR